MSALRVVVADDDMLLREGLCSLLSGAGIDIVGQAGDAVELLAVTRRQTPDVAIIDVRMPPTGTTEGFDAARVIRDELPDVGILVLSAHVDVEHALDLLSTDRGIGYLLKSRVTDFDELIDALNRIAEGASVVDPALVRELVSYRRRTEQLAVLTAREKQVLALMAEGRSNTGIAQLLWIAEGTVEKHVRHIFTKLQIADSSRDHRRVRAVIAFLSRP